MKKILIVLLFITSFVLPQGKKQGYNFPSLWKLGGTTLESVGGWTLKFPSPFTLGSTSVTTTGTQLNYLAGYTATSGYLPYYNGTKLTNSGIYTDGINYGIGTTTPLGLLHLYKTTGANLLLDGDATAQPYLDFKQAGTEKAYIQYIDNGVNTDYLRYDAPVHYFSTGNVGIGTTAPSDKLDIYGGNLRVGGANSYMVFNGNEGVSTWINSPSWALSLRTAGTDRIYIKNDGNVGIGLTNPTYKTQVNSNILNAFAVSTTGLGVKASIDSTGHTVAKSLALGGATIGTYKLAVGGDVLVQTAGGASIYVVRTSNRYGMSADNNIVDLGSRDAGDVAITTGAGVRRAYFNDVDGSMTLGTTAGTGTGALFAGSITNAGAYTGNTLTRGTDAFTTTATADTVAITGASVNDIYVVSYVTAVTAAESPLSVVSTATGFIVKRPAGTTSGAVYAYIRQK